MSAHTYFPHYWTVLRIEYPSETVYRLLGSWSGSYLDGSSWRLNSGIKKVCVSGTDHLDFIGDSGSIYRCHKNSYGVHVESLGVLEKFLSSPNLKVEQLPESTDWLNKDWTI